MKRFLKEWGLFLSSLTLIALAYFFIFINVTVDGHSMDPTLANGEKLFVLRVASIERFDIVVAQETDENGNSKRIVKRVIGTPGDTITYDHDQLYVNGELVDEPYLHTYLDKFHEDKLQETYSYNKFFQSLAQEASAFTIDKTKSPKFTVMVPEGHYYLLGDDRIVSKDSRENGTLPADDIIGEVKFRYWPLSEIGSITER